MGRGVAQDFAANGYDVILIDIADASISKKEIYNLRFRLFKKSEELKDPDEVIRRMTFTNDYDLLNDVIFLVENVPERWELKEEIYKKIDNICSECCIFAVNTSCISITKIGALTNRADRIIGTHL